eukprot:3668399-Rhodomonas_salina.2
MALINHTKVIAVSQSVLLLLSSPSSYPDAVSSVSARAATWTQQIPRQYRPLRSRCKAPSGGCHLVCIAPVIS